MNSENDIIDIMEGVGVFAFARDGVVNTGEPSGPVPVEWLMWLRHRKGYNVYAHGNQNLKDEADVPGVFEFSKEAKDKPDRKKAFYDGTKSRTILDKRLHKILEANPGADEYIVVDNEEEVVDDRWTLYSPNEFVNEFEERFGNVDSIEDVYQTIQPPEVPDPSEVDDSMVDESESGIEFIPPDVSVSDKFVDPSESPEDVDYYLGVLPPESLREPAQIMYDEGERDVFVGKMIREHVANYDRDEKTAHRICVVQASGEPGYHGVVVTMPDDDPVGVVEACSNTRDSGLVEENRVTQYRVPDHVDCSQLVGNMIGWSDDVFEPLEGEQ